MIFPDLWFDQDDEIFKDYVVLDGEGNKSNYLPKLSRVNILIGSNNSGKSRFHRKVFHQLFKTKTSDSEKKKNLEENSLDSSLFNLSEVPTMIQDLFEKVKQHTPKALLMHERQFRTAFTSLEELVKKNEHISFKALSRRDVLNIKTEITQVQTAFIQAFDKDTFQGEKRLSVPTEIAFLEFESMKKVIQKINELSKMDTSRFNFSYIPALRTLRAFNEKPVRTKFWTDHFKTYKVDERVSEFLFTGESLYEDIQSNLLGLINQIEAHIEFSQFIGNTFYRSKKVSITAPISKNENDSTNIMVKIGDDPELPITELGDGVQAIIGLTYQLYTRADQSHFLFIDEPEQNLHPGFQRIFMETLLQDRFKNTQVFLCTHSNHFLDMSLDYPDDISIYSFQKKRKENTDESYFEIKYRAGRDKEVLQMIGARNSSVFLSNCTLWVEGITDRLYIRAWLDIYQKMIQLEDSNNKKYHEDIHFSFIEFGGANITHWSFLDDEEGINVESLCGPVLVLADRDNTSNPNSAKSKRHETLKQRLGKNYAMVERREIENVLLPKQITASASQVFGNEQVLTLQFTFNDYESSYLGAFLDERVGLKEGKGNVFASESGTIKNKVKFCRAVVNELKTKTVEANTVEELKNLILPEGIKESDERLDTPYHLAKRVYEFIAEHNS